MKSIFAMKKFLLIIAVVLLFSNCEKDNRKLYEEPPWLGGSILETLEGEGNYTILIELMKKAGYEEPITKGLFTIFAANDSAYQEYFNSKGIASVEDLTEEQAFQLFTLNLLNTPRARQQLVFDYLPWHGGWQEPRSEIGATLWRVPTKSKSNNYTEEVKYFEDRKDQTLLIAGQEKMVPLLSTEFYSDYNGATDGSDYNYFFPTTEWSGLQWYNANIVESQKCSNGFLYYLDRAVPEIPNIEEYLKNHLDKFGVFYDLMQRFAEYSFTGEYNDDATRTQIFSKTYRTISNINSEQGPSPGEPYNRRNSYSAFIPTDDVFQNYINNTFLQHFENLDSVPEISLAFLAQACLKTTFDIPSKIERSFVNNYGDPINIDLQNDVDDAILLSNGPIYVMNKYYPPKAFTGTVSPIFFNSNYTTYLYGLNDAQMIATLTAAGLEVTIFAPTNEGLLEGGIRYYTPRKRLEKQEEDGTWSALDELEAKSFVADHVITDNLVGEQIDFSGEGFAKMSSGNYIYYNNKTIEGGGNQELGNSAKIIESKKGDNGMFYALDKAILAPKNDAAMFIAQDEDLSEFYNLLYEAGLADTTIDSETLIEYPTLSFLLTDDFWTVFAPTNDAIIEARNNAQIPDSINNLRQFLLYHFIPANVIFDDGILNGKFLTASADPMATDQNYYAPIDIINSKKNMKLVDRAGNTINLNHNSANNLVLKGVVHKIDKILLDQ